MKKKTLTLTITISLALFSAFRFQAAQPRWRENGSSAPGCKVRAPHTRIAALGLSSKVMRDVIFYRGPQIATNRVGDVVT